MLNMLSLLPKLMCSVYLAFAIILNSMNQIEFLWYVKLLNKLILLSFEIQNSNFGSTSEDQTKTG